MSVFIVMCVLEETQIENMQEQEKETERDNNRNFKLSLTWDVRSCMVCEGPIWSLTSESCVYYRWNNLSNGDTTSGIVE